MSCYPAFSKALRRYHLRIGSAMALYVLLTAMSDRVVRHHPPAHSWLYFWAVLPATPMIAVIVIAGRYIAEETDEFQRYRFLQSLLIATGALLSLIAFNDFLRSFAAADVMPPFVGIVLFFTTIAIVSLIQSGVDKVSARDQ